MAQVSEYTSFLGTADKMSLQNRFFFFQKDETLSPFYHGYNTSSTRYLLDAPETGQYSDKGIIGLNSRFSSQAARLSGNGGYYRTESTGRAFQNTLAHEKTFHFVFKIKSNHRRALLFNNVGNIISTTSVADTNRWGIYIDLVGNLAIGDFYGVSGNSIIILEKLNLDQHIGEWIDIGIHISRTFDVVNSGWLVVSLNNEIVIDKLWTQALMTINRGTEDLRHGGTFGGRTYTLTKNLAYGLDSETFGTIDTNRVAPFTADMEVLFLGECLNSVHGSNFYPLSKYFEFFKYDEIIDQKELNRFQRKLYIDSISRPLDYFPLDCNSNKSAFKIHSNLKLEDVNFRCGYTNIISGSLKFNLYKKDVAPTSSVLDQEILKNYTFFANPYVDGVFLSVGTVSIEYSTLNGFQINANANAINTGQILFGNSKWFQLTVSFDVNHPHTKVFLLVVADNGTEYNISIDVSSGTLFTNNLDILQFSNINIFSLIEHYGRVVNIGETQLTNPLLMDGDHEFFMLGNMPICRASESKVFSLVDTISTRDDKFKGVLEFDGNTSYIDFSDSLPQDKSFTLFIDFVRLNGQPSKEILFSSDNLEIYFNNENRLTLKILGDVGEEIIDYDVRQCVKYHLVVVFKRFSGNTDKLFYINNELVHTSTIDNANLFIGDVYFGKKSPDGINSGTTFKGILSRFEIKIDRDYRDSVLLAKYRHSTDEYYNQLSIYGIPSLFLDTTHTSPRFIGHINNSYSNNAVVIGPDIFENGLNSISFNSNIIDIFVFDVDKAQLFISAIQPITYTYNKTLGTFTQLVNRSLTNIVNHDTVREIRYFQSGFEEQILVHNFTTGILGDVYNIDKNDIISHPKRVLSKDGIVSDIGTNGTIYDSATIKVLNFDGLISNRIYSTIGFSEDYRFFPGNDEEFQTLFEHQDRWATCPWSKYSDSTELIDTWQDTSLVFLGYQEYVQPSDRTLIGQNFLIPSVLPVQDFRRPNKSCLMTTTGDVFRIYNVRNTGTSNYKLRKLTSADAASDTNAVSPANNRNIVMMSNIRTDYLSFILQISDNNLKSFSYHWLRPTGAWGGNVINHGGLPEVINRTHICGGLENISGVVTWSIGYGDSSQTYLNSFTYTETGGTSGVFGQTTSADISAILPYDTSEERRIFQYQTCQDRNTLAISIQINLKYISNGLTQIIYQCSKYNRNASKNEQLIFISPSNEVSVKGGTKIDSSPIILTSGEEYQINIVFQTSSYKVFLNGEYVYKYDYVDSPSSRPVLYTSEEDFIPAFECIGNRKHGTTAQTISPISNFVKWPYPTSAEFIRESYRKWKNIGKSVVSGKITKSSCEPDNNKIVTLIDSEGTVIESQTTNSQGEYYFSEYFVEDGYLIK